MPLKLPPNLSSNELRLPMPSEYITPFWFAMLLNEYEIEFMLNKIRNIRNLGNVHIRGPHIVMIRTDAQNGFDFPFNNLLSSVLDSHAPLRTVKVSAKPIPFMTSEIKDLMIARDRSHRKVRRSGVERDWSEFKEKRRITKQRLREAEIAYIQEQIKSSKEDSNCIWKTIRQCLPSWRF